MDTTTGMSAPPMGMMMRTPSTKARASMKKKAAQFSVNMKARPSTTEAVPIKRFSRC